MTTAMMSLEGVLGAALRFDVKMQVNETGQRLFAALKDWYRIVLVTTETDQSKVYHWLQTHGVSGEAETLLNITDYTDPIDVRVRQLRALRARRTAVSVVIDNEPLFIAHAMAQGVVGLLYAPARPALLREDLAPQEIRSWDAIVNELELERNRL